MTNMKWVEISAFNPETEKNDVFAKCILNDDDGTVVFEGETDVFPEEIFLPGREQPLTPSDGIEYLRSLGQEFHSAGAMASDILES
ncbi:MAG: hypothetical protein V1738_04080 [Patescibacteria group bacterium]